MSKYKGINAAMVFLSVDNEDEDDTVVHDSSATEPNNVDEFLYHVNGAVKISNSMKEEAPIAEFGGQDNVVKTVEENRSHGTHQVSYPMDGTRTTPNIARPSASFFPNQGVIGDIFGSLNSAVGNYQLVLALIALGWSSGKDKDNHTINYVTLPEKVTDNQDLKDDLLGE
jgi:hypothetical protein